MATSGSTGVLPVSLKACYHTSENKKLLRSLSNPGTSALGASQFLAASRKPIPWRNESRSLPPAQSTSKTRPGSPRLTMAAVWLPDRLVPLREQTAVSQKQKPAARSSASAATASSSKSCPELFKLNADVSWLEHIFIHYTGQLMKLISSSF